MEPLKMRLAVLTTGRQDWGILRSTCLALSGEVILLAGGMHAEPRFGGTAQALVDDGFTPELLRWAGEQTDAPAHVQSAEALRVVGDALAKHRPDALLLVGDRFETAAAALAATVARVPIVHLHGGEETAGAFDNALRHAITKLAHLHLVSHDVHARRVIAMGEDPATVHVVGAPGLDNLRRTDLATRGELEAVLGMSLVAPVVLVTLHPATLGGAPELEVAAMLAAMDRVPATYVITLPNVDPGAASIRTRLVAEAAKPGRCAVDALGERRYFGLMQICDAMLGNSSSGLIEAPVLRLPVINIGDRQQGRLREPNVVDVAADVDAIETALRRALEPAFRAALPARSTFGDGHAAARIVEILATWRPQLVKATVPA
ncbi:MAG TPA: UDP-N-acetylglucosamine 2-epimerase [Kofleriaceae bacterium]|nr:UDP-N-acetylglucosamine 2-epimerase [Kofleriaceae bacterium]